MAEALAPRFAALLDALAAEADPPTTIRDPEEALEGHVRDSLAAVDLPALRKARSIADIGAGAGFPGLALALALPHARVDLIEATARKTDVIARLAAAAGAANARPVAARAEEWAAREGRGAYEVVTARAVAPLGVLLEYAAPLLKEGGNLVAWKGARDLAEEEGARRAAAQLGMELADPVAVQPFPRARDRHLHVACKIAPTPERFPRRAGMARKRPLG